MPIKMHSSTHPKAISFSLKTLSAAVLSALLCSNVYAAGFGKLTVLSSLGQPLRAEIELTSVSKDEASSIMAKLASTEAFRQANIDFNPVLFSLRFAIDTRGGRQFVRVTSTQPINEPFLDMLLELGGTSSRLVREYTVLLDPADLKTAQSAQINTRASAAANSAQATNQAQQSSMQTAPVPQPSVAERSARHATSSNPSARRGSAQPSTETAQADSYQVKKGDSLAKIANQVKPEGVSLDQMLVALYRANTNAFVDHNMNRLRAGQILTVPDADAVQATSARDARGIVIAQAMDFNHYRNKLAAQVATAEPQKTGEAKQSAAGKITTQVEEKPTAANESKDKLKLSKAGAAGAAAGKSASIAAGTEEIIAKDKALAEANARVKELEKNLGDLQKLLEIKNKTLEEQQKQAAELAKAAPKNDAGVSSSPAATPAVPAVPAAATAPAASTPNAQAPTAPAPVADKNQAASAPAASAPAAKAPVVPAKPKVTPVKPATPVPVETSFLDDLLGNSVLLSSLAVGLLGGLGALAFYRTRRKKDNRQFDDSILNDSSLKANSLFGSTGGQSIDTNNSVFNSSFTPSASQLDTNEVDPVAEADVYIAYGRDAQAEEILKEALRTQPERNAVRLKLLEIYANRKDLRAFETLATELYSMTKGEGEEWAQAAAMGIALDPNNPLYAGGKQAADAGKSAALMAPTQPLDEHELDDLLNTTQQNDSTLGSLDALGAHSAYFDNTLDSVAAPDVPELPADETLSGTTANTGESSVNMLDFDLDGLDMKAPQIPEPEAVKPMTHESESPTDLDIGMLDFGSDNKPAALDLNLDDDAPATAMSVDVGKDDLSFMPSDLPSMDHNEDANEAPLGQQPASMDFDLSDISLDLNPDAANSAPKQESTQAAQEPALDSQMPHTEPADFALNAEEGHSGDSEMATKLDLAIAYQEIGDKDGARELLDEVIKGGTEEQSAKAKSLLVSLA